MENKRVTKYAQEMTEGEMTERDTVVSHCHGLECVSLLLPHSTISFHSVEVPILSASEIVSFQVKIASLELILTPV